VLLVAAAAMVGTLPGRTQGLGLITEPLLRDLSLDRVRYAQLNLWATIAGSLGALAIGRVIDRLGSRVALSAVALALGASVCGMSRTTSFAGLALGLLLSRTLGQSALSVASLTLVGRTFSGRIEPAMATYSIALSVGFMAAFPAVGAIVQRAGWRAAWLAVGIALVVGLAPLAWLLLRREPRMAPTDQARGTDGTEGYTWTAALRTAAFWTFATGAALYGLVASGIGLFNESILAERGFGPDVYYASLAVTALAALVGNFGGGWIAGRMAQSRLMAAALAILALGLGVLPQLTSRAQVMAWAAAMGLGGGMVMVSFFSVWPRLYGRRELGRIQGAAQALTVLASAVGPLLLAWCVDRTGSYAWMFRLLAGIVALTAAATLATPEPA
jgi:MFS family permease